MSFHGGAAFYRPDKSTPKYYRERMIKYSDEHVTDGGKKRKPDEMDDAKSKLGEERLSMFFVDHVIENDKK